MTEDWRDLPHPVDMFPPCCTKSRPIGFTSQKEWRAKCAYSDQRVIGYGYGSSVVSQAEADEIALAAAQQDAANRLNCMTTPIGASTI